MADRQIFGLTADTTPARTDVIAKQISTGATEAEKSTIAEVLALTTAADISDASANGRSLITAANYAAMQTLLSQLSFTTLAVSGQSNIVADSAADTLTIAAGANVTLTTNATTDTLTIAATGGGGSASYTAVTAISVDTNITSSHISNLLLVSGSGVDLTLVETSWTAGAWVDIIVTGTTTVNLTAGTNGINRAGNDTATLYPDTLVRVTFRTGSDPMWVMGFDEFLTLSANQFAVTNNAGTALEARAQKFMLPFAGTSLANGTYAVAKHGDVPVTLNEVTARCSAGSCSYKLQKNGVDYNGHGTALGVTTTKRDTACTETLAEDDETTLIISAASGLGMLYITAKGTRTGA